jgi:hypothetical protein
MAQMPVEIIEVGDVPTESITVALSLANSLQKEFVYNRLAETEAQPHPPALIILRFIVLIRSV